MLDGIFCNTVVMMPSYSTVTDALALLGKFWCELPRGINAVVGAVGTYLDTGASGVSLESQLGLDGLGPGESNLVNDSELPTGGIAEDSTTTVLLGGKAIPPCRELTTEKRGLVLVREYEVPRTQLVHREGASRSFGDGRPSLGCALLLAELTGSAFWRENGGGSHFDPDWAEKSTPTKPLGVLPPKVSPLGVPGEEMLLERRQIGCGRLGDTFKGKSLGSLGDIMKGTHNW
jgi:hypothetical protein